MAPVLAVVVGAVARGLVFTNASPARFVINSGPGQYVFCRWADERHLHAGTRLSGVAS